MAFGSVLSSTLSFDCLMYHPKVDPTVLHPGSNLFLNVVPLGCALRYCLFHLCSLIYMLRCKPCKLAEWHLQLSGSA